MMMPAQDCLQYLTASTGTIASFNWDTSVTTVSADTHIHLSSQQYDICIRRTRNYCSVCYSPQIYSSIAGTGGSFGVLRCSLLQYGAALYIRWEPATPARPRW